MSVPDESIYPLADLSACNRDQQAWVLAAVRRADPDRWRDCVRDSAIWDNPAALRDLADRANVAEQPPQLRAVLGARFRARNLDAVSFLTRVVSAYPADFWVNIEMGNALSQRSNPVEAIGYYRTALAQRPQTVLLHYALGGLYLSQRRWAECIAEFEQAVRLASEDAWCHNRLGFAFAWKGGRDDEAIAPLREAIPLDANPGDFGRQSGRSRVPVKSATTIDLSMPGFPGSFVQFGMARMKRRRDSTEPSGKPSRAGYSTSPVNGLRIRSALLAHVSLCRRMLHDKNLMAP